jgi:predicted transcriptional regulator
MIITTLPVRGEALRLARVVTKRSLTALAYEAGVSRFRIFEAEKNRLSLSAEEVEKVRRVLLPDRRIDQALGAAEDLSKILAATSVRKNLTTGDVENVLIVLKALACDPDMSEVERNGIAVAVYRLERRPVASFAKFGI